MPMKGDLPMIAGEGIGFVDKMMTVCRSTGVDRLIFSIIVRVCFVYEFHLIWN